MKKVLRKNRDGSSYYSFLFFDRGLEKWVRLSKAYIQKRFGSDIITEDDAKKVVKILDAEHESMRLRLAKRTEWEREFYNFSSLLGSYSKAQKKRAPNSYKNNIHYLKHYVLHFFLSIKRCNNIDYWPELYSEFQNWLEIEAALVKNPERTISYGAKNHCIKALNTFMRLLYQDRIINRLALCEKFPSHKLNERTLDDVISQEEMEQVYLALKHGGYKREAIFYRMLFYTGLRFNEALGMSLADLHMGTVKHSSLELLLDKYEITYRGYMVIASQPDHSTKGLRGEDGKIKRKPLKGKKKISEKFSRVIVIANDQLWGELVELYNCQVEELGKSKWGSNPADYALFDGLDRTTATTRLQKAYKAAGLRYRSWHCCRHSCATHIIGATGDYTLAVLWLGHSSSSVIERYVHLHQAIVRMAAKKGERGQSIIKKLDP